MGTREDRNGKNLIDQEEMARIHRRTVQERSKWPDNHDDVVTPPDPDILECDVKWSLGSTAANRASRGDGIPAELFKILKDDAIKVLHTKCQQI